MKMRYFQRICRIILLYTCTIYI